MRISLIKVIVILGICVAIFGAANVKGCVNKGVDFTINKVDQGVNAIKNSDTVKKTVEEVGGAVKDATGDVLNKAKDSIGNSVSNGVSDALDKAKSSLK